MRCGALAVGVLFSLCSGQAVTQDVPTFGADVESVYVDAFVSGRGESTPHLTEGDFAVWDNGVPQTVKVVRLEDVPLRSVLVFDASASVRGEKLRHLRAAGRAFLAELQPGDEPSLLAFSHELRRFEPPGPTPQSLAVALGRLRPSGGTALFDALFAALKLVERSAGRPVVLVFTDGDDNFSWLGEQEVVELAEESNAIIYAVGVQERALLSPRGLPSDEPPGAERWEFLREIADITGGRAWDVESTAKLQEAFLEILEELDRRYLLTYNPEGVDEPGWHELRVRVKGHDVRARRGYYR